MAVAVVSAAVASSPSSAWASAACSIDNLLTANGNLAGVIDFGCCAVGDPACDLTIAWTLLSGAARDAFREGLQADEPTWARARGWALWKALITIDKDQRTDSTTARAARATIEEVLADHHASHGGI